MLTCTGCGCKGEADTGEICPKGICIDCCTSARLDCDCWEIPCCDECDEQHAWLCPLGRCEACCDMTPCGCLAILARNETQVRMHGADDSDLESESSDEILLLPAETGVWNVTA